MMSQMARGEKMDKYENGERIFSSLDKSYKEYGKNRIFLVGDNLNDLFLWNLRDGVYSLVENCKRYAKDNNFKWFVYQKDTNERVFYKLEKDKWIEKEYREFNSMKVGGALGPKFSNKAPNFTESPTKNDSEPTDNRELDSILTNLIAVDRFKNEEIFLFIENFDWLAKFYDSENDNTLIKKIKDLEKLKRHLVIISSKQVETLKEKFYEEFDEKELITIGKPNQKEIETTLNRVLWKSIGYSPNSLDVNEVSTNFSNTKTTLREVIRVLKKKLNEYGKTLTLDNFEFKNKIQEKITLKDVVLEVEKKREIAGVLSTFKNEEESKKKGIILTGPPGTGKTYLAKALANEFGMYFMCPKLSDLKGQYVGQSAPKIKDMFEEARLNEPTLIFLDEIDTLFPLRDGDDRDSYTNDMTNEFLQQLDGVDNGTQKVFILSATNRVETVDLAVRSRLGESIEISLPTENQRLEIFKANLKNILSEKFWNELDAKYLQDLKSRSERMSGRDIKNFCAGIENNIKINQKDLSKPSELYLDVFNSQFAIKKRSLVDDIKRMTGLECKFSNDIKEDKLFGIKKEEKIIQEVLSQIKEDEEKKLQRKNFEISRQNGILLYGPPGNGKTELISQITKKESLIFIKAESKDIIGHTSADTLNSLDKIFTKALQLSKLCDDKEGVVIFFDEFDAICGPQMNSAVRGTLLGKLADKEGIRSDDSKLIVVAATNYYEVLDEATIRKGRFDVHVKIDNPEKQYAIEILKNLCELEKLAVGYDIGKFYDDIKNIEFKNKNPNLSTFYRKQGKLTEEEIVEHIEHERNNFRVSGAFLKNTIQDLKRYAFNTRLIIKNNYIETNQDIVDSFIKER